MEFPNGMIIPGDVVVEVCQELAEDMAEISGAYAGLTAVRKRTLEVAVAPILKRAREREALAENDLIALEEFMEEHQREYEILLPYLEAAFPLVTSADEEKKHAYVAAFVEYCRQRPSIQ